MDTAIDIIIRIEEPFVITEAFADTITVAASVGITEVATATAFGSYIVATVVAVAGNSNFIEEVLEGIAEFMEG
jgi:hypothetical protein